MAELYLILINKGLRTVSQLPQEIKEQVIALTVAGGKESYAEM